MTAVRTIIRDRVALAALTVARQLGVALTFTTHAGAAVTVYGFILTGSSETTRHGRGGLNIYTSTFEIPRQTGFPPSGDHGYLGSTVTDAAGYVWPVSNFKGDTVGAVFTLDCEREGKDMRYNL